ncbi:hypothetical protein E1B28_000682 [Marasmius oreades]|uniref:Xylanolytic transcriptional activator regulatory domain-containing protein n=1 Tax=Marasmius oreades TaxID=181124 RepID=A0A9P8AEM6_9AGAR|nr:uncharacterized protein E1B28_000682 [Marasmius oreades]KAG7098774.1 hypothetical protein E1B28_000682 [Marasmius oreades]
MPNNQCSNCIAFNLDCTHSEPTKKRGPKSRYVENLEKRVRSLEAIVRKYAPHINVDELGKSSSSSPLLSSSNGSSPAATNESTDPDEEEDDFAHIGLSEQFRKMTFKEDTIHQTFFGPSSGFMLLQKAHAAKTEFTGKESIHSKHFKRVEYWGIHAWEGEFKSRSSEQYYFPEGDLLWSLISLYFDNVNIYLPILHGPSFKRSIYEGLHLHDPQFGGMVLLVCALGARYSDDSRVFWVSGKQLSAGWAWFRQVRMTRGSLFSEASVYEIQFYCLATLYIIGTSNPQVSYMLVGIGMRFAIELGIHRRKPEGTKNTIQNELEKRVFWVLLSLDRCVCNFTGRPSALRDEDYDQELPVDCDDEYWQTSDPDLEFKQPPNKPSKISCFICYLKLCEILAFTLRTLYSIKKSKLMLGLVGNQWEQRIISELDSSLNNWINSIPEHLRWDPSRENVVFFNQSAFLHLNYYNVQIQVHRPFIMKSSLLMFPSLAICTNAARSCINVMYRHSQRDRMALPHTFYACFGSGVVLLTHIWNSKLAGMKIDVPREMADVHKLMHVLSLHDKRWSPAGRFLDLFCELARGLNEHEEAATTTPPSPPLSSQSPSVHPAYHIWQDMDSMETEQVPSLPFNTAELGRERSGYLYSPLPQVVPPTLPAALLNNNGQGAYVDGRSLGTPEMGYNGSYPQAVRHGTHDQGAHDYVANDWQRHDPHAMWPNIPPGIEFGLDEWGHYIESSFVGAS